MVAHTCNPSTSGGRGRWITRSRDRDHPGQHGETPSLLKIRKISWAWWCVPVVPATWEAEARELPEPRRRSLQWAEIMPLHFSLGGMSETASQKKKKTTHSTWILWALCSVWSGGNDSDYLLGWFWGLNEILCTKFIAWVFGSQQRLKSSVLPPLSRSRTQIYF